MPVTSTGSGTSYSAGLAARCAEMWRMEVVDSQIATGPTGQTTRVGDLSQVVSLAGTPAIVYTLVDDTGTTRQLWFARKESDGHWSKTQWAAPSVGMVIILLPERGWGRRGSAGARGCGPSG